MIARRDFFLALALASCILVGCATRQSTGVRVEDDQAMAAEMAEALRRDLFADRTADSPPMVIGIHRVENLTNDVIPQNRLWQIMAGVRDAQPIVELRATKNVSFVIPAEYLHTSRLRGTDAANQGFALNRAPTHAMTATFRSLRRSSRDQRSETYSCTFEMTDIATGELVWQGTFRFKRLAAGKAYD